MRAGRSFNRSASIANGLTGEAQGAASLRLGSTSVVFPKQLHSLDGRSLGKKSPATAELIYLALAPGEKEAHFQPYRYGPFSKQIHAVLTALIHRGCTCYRERRLSIVEPDSQAPGSDPLYDRLRKTAAFLAERGYTGTADLLALAKVDLLSRTDRDRAAG